MIIFAEQLLYQALAADPDLTGLVSDRIYAVKAPQGAAKPLIIYRRSRGRPEQTLTGYQLVTTDFAIEAWSKTDLGVKKIGWEIERVMAGQNEFTCLFLYDAGWYDDVSESHNITLHYTVWEQRGFVNG